MKISGLIVAAGLVVLGVMVLVSCVNNDIRGEDTMNNNTLIPPIDAERTDVTATATFAMG